MRKYFAYYEKQKIEVEAETSYEAQRLAAVKFKQTKKPWNVAVVLADVYEEVIRTL